ncbi:MAG: MBL fold metallo-hydrolase [Acidobacteria bacterium]|nr:MAG: MBL fold metallo-hydrolase [Acidobacteriota bacterium]REK03840.1 MAG: MBL fold metallo-hydrolase [Acidobacteriota bacterium]
MLRGAGAAGCHRVGEVRIRRVVELEAAGGTRFLLPDATREAVREIDWLRPHFADAEGNLILSIHSWLLDTPSGRVVVDTGLGNDKQREIPLWNARSGPYLEELTSAGFAPGDIDLVINTHLHVDHVGWNTRWRDGAWTPTFPSARYLLGRVEWEHWSRRPEPQYRQVIDDSVRPVVEAGLADLFEMDQRLTPEISAEPTTGHSIGHVSLWIESAGERALVSGDFLHHPAQAARPEWCSTADHDRDQAIATRRRMLARLADEGVAVFGMHFGEPCRVLRDGDAFRLEPTTSSESALTGSDRRTSD